MRSHHSLSDWFLDVPIFKDALAGIKAVKKDGFTVDGIININKSFVYSKEEDPAIPGHLRNSMYNPDDNIAIYQSLLYFPEKILTIYINL